MNSPEARFPWPCPGGRSFYRPLLELLLFVCLAIGATWPLALNSRDHLPLGTETAATVPLFNLWTVWWNADRIGQGFAHYWDAPVFYPDEGTFSYSEPQPLTAAVAPIIMLADSIPLGYNFLVLAGLCLNGLVTYWLLREVSLPGIYSLTGGVMMTLLPLVHSWIGVFQLIPLFGVLSVFFCLVRLHEDARISRGVLLGISLAVTYLLCSYYGLFLVIPVSIAALFMFWEKMLSGKMWLSLFAAFMVFLVIVFPVVMEQYQRLHGVDMRYDAWYLKSLSANLEDYLFPPLQKGTMFLGFYATPSHDGFCLCPGYLKSVLALLGICAGLFSKYRRWTIFCCLLLAVSLLLSLGLNIRIGTFIPYTLLLEHVPGFLQARNIFRFSIFVHVMITLLSVQGLYYCMTSVAHSVRHRYLRQAAQVLIIAAGVLAVIENVPKVQPLYGLPSIEKNRNWIDWLENNTSSNAAVVCIPFPYLPDVASYQQETVWMYWQTFHHRKMLNGYSGFFPPHFLQMKRPMAEFPASRTIEELVGMGISYCLVKSETRHGGYIRHNYRRDSRLSLEFRDPAAGIDIYRLHPVSGGSAEVGSVYRQ